MINMQTELTVFISEPIAFYVSIVANKLVFLDSSQPRYNYNIQFITEGAVDSCLLKFVSHFRIIKKFRYPTVVNSNIILGRES